MHNYGYMYLEKEEYRAEALNYLMGAANSRVPESMLIVTTLMLKGEYESIVTENHDEVLFRISKDVLKAGVDGARYVHALVLIRLYKRFPVDSLRESAEELLLAEIETNAQAAFTLGRHYKSGKYFKLDEVKGIELIQKSCDMGFEWACKRIEEMSKKK